MGCFFQGLNEDWVKTKHQTSSTSRAWHTLLLLINISAILLAEIPVGKQIVFVGGIMVVLPQNVLIIFQFVLLSDDHAGSYPIISHKLQMCWLGSSTNCTATPENK